ncbi:hypothetical protein HY970_03000 [Candidatus Kaiserbacteria bacterium]|nr:hypothetical protein [Candidatus Kaiserbacteria bacterium]
MILWHNSTWFFNQGTAAKLPYIADETQSEIPPVHLARLRRQAEEAGCSGLLACINQISKAFLARKQMVFEELPDVRIMATDETSELKVAWKELCATVETRYSEHERRIEAESADEDDDDCTAIPRMFVYMAETVPTLRPEIRMPLDRFFGEMAREQLAT